jgi:hypothetical protein
MSRIARGSCWISRMYWGITAKSLKHCCWNNYCRRTCYSCNDAHLYRAHGDGCTHAPLIAKLHWPHVFAGGLSVTSSFALRFTGSVTLSTPWDSTLEVVASGALKGPWWHGATTTKHS